jgi:hypothetical protein
MLQPVIMHDIDISTLTSLAEFAEESEKSLANPALTPYLKNAVEYYRAMAGSLRRPFLVRMHLVSPDVLPEYIPRTIGYSLTHQDKTGTWAPGFQVALPNNLSEVNNCLKLISWLEPSVFNPKPVDVRFDRLRFLVDAQQANSLFRLPFPPEPGIAGVHFS